MSFDFQLRKLSIRELMEKVHEQMCNEEEKAKNSSGVRGGLVEDAIVDAVVLPDKWHEWYGTQAMHNFLVYMQRYIQLWVKLRKIEQDGGSPSAADISKQRSHLRVVAAQYSRIILHTSGFERAREDQLFGEAFFAFTCRIARHLVEPTLWKALQSELEFLFRGSTYRRFGSEQVCLCK